MQILEKLILRGNRVLIEPIEEKQEEQSTIVAPESAKSETVKGKVVKIGDGPKIVEGLQVGDTAWYVRQHATPFPIDDKPYFIVSGESGIIATI